MAAIKIPGTIHIDKSYNSNKYDDSNIDEFISEELSEIDPLDNGENVEIEFVEDSEPNEHADINVDIIAGSESGYDLPIQRLEQEIKLAEHDEENNMIKESLRHRIRIVTLSRLIYPENDWKIGKYKTDLAHSYLDLLGSRYAAQCEEHASEALKMLSKQYVEVLNEKEGSEFLKTLIFCHYALARAELILKKPEESEKNIQKSLLNLKKLQKLSTITDEEIFPISLKLNMAAGKISLRLQKLVAASHYYNLVCEMVKVNKDIESVDLIPIYQFLGKIEQSNGNLSNHSKGVEFYQMAHDLTNKHYDSHSMEVIQSSRALATAYSIIGTIDAEKSAETYLNECLQSLILNHKEEHSLISDLNSDLARLLIRCDRKNEAIQKLKSNLSKDKKVFGEYSEEFLANTQLMGSLQLSCGNVVEALKYYEQALLVEELRNNPNSKPVQNIKQIIKKIKSNPQTDSASDKHGRPPFIATHRSK